MRLLLSGTIKTKLRTPYLQDKAGVYPEIENEVTFIHRLNRGLDKYLGAFTRLRLSFPL
jgi:hypothetical protein